MSNILDYLKLRGDVPMSVDPFNEVDNLVLSEIAYTKLDGIVPGPEHLLKRINIKDASDLFFFFFYMSELAPDNNGATANAPNVLKEAAASRRFGKTKIFSYVNHIDVDSKVQFSAMSFILPDHSIYVAYRGTDHTIVGWQEDFNMSYLDATPGQKQAADYLNRIAKFTLRPIHVGGHSKGGNFAVYAAAFSSNRSMKKIRDVWSNDGPGFNHSIADTKEYRNILPKVRSVVPEHSIIGMIMENAYSHEIVKSDAAGILQHDPMSWQVQGNRFETTDQLDKDSILFGDILRSWLKGLDKETRKEFVSILFSSLSYGGKRTTDELELSKHQTLLNMWNAMRELPPEKQELFRDVMMKLAKSWGETMFLNLKEKWFGNR